MDLFYTYYKNKSAKIKKKPRKTDIVILIVNHKILKQSIQILRKKINHNLKHLIEYNSGFSIQIL